MPNSCLLCPRGWALETLTVRSTSGSVHVPRTATGGTCEITTTSGSIDISCESDAQ